MIEPAATSPPAGIRATGNGVFYCDDDIPSVTGSTLAFLKSEALRAPQRRSRLCTHPATTASVHEMFIAQHRDGYLRPHRHSGKAESYYVIEGAARLPIFETDGSIRCVFDLDAGRSGLFYVRLPADTFHTFLLQTEWLIYIETTSGPFDRSNTEFAVWSPPERDGGAATAYAAALARRCRDEWGPFRDRAPATGANGG